ncbi:MAG: two-component regulator propeller domain-containing protein [bacterium]
MSARNFLILWVLCGFLLFALPASAVETSVWEVVTANDFGKGEPKNVSIRSDGRVTLSPLLQLLYDTEELYVWCLAQDSKGNLYAGTGNNGRVFKVTEEGEGFLFFDSPELEILSLATDRGGNLYAGTGPDGIIYKISPQGETSTFFETKERYVWALVFDAQDNLYAGTGDGGKIFKIGPHGEGGLLYGSNETHIMALAVDSQNNLYAGSEGNGIVYRISPAKDVFLLYDAPQKEIHSLALAQEGTIYAGATEAVISVKKPLAQKERPPQGGRKNQGEAVIKPQEVTKVAKEKSVVYQINPDGVVTKLWTSSALLLSLAVRDDGSLIIGTGDDGKLYSLLTDRTSLSLAKSSESQILSLLRGSRGQTLLGTGSMGKIYRVTSDYAEEGSLVSEVYDTETVSKWGKIPWRADVPSGTEISFATRSGNSLNPDDTWSDWSSHAEGGPIASPPARFIQWRAKLRTSDPSATPTLKHVSVAYLQRNLRPEITSVTVYPPGQRPGKLAKQTPSKPDEMSTGPMSKRGVRSADWKANDPNNDRLVYTIFFRGTDERTWKVLKEEEKATSYTWDTESLPDGLYVIRVVVSDSPSNPPSTALSAEKVSEPFMVDNTPPRVFDVKATQRSGKGPLIGGRSEDATSIITKAEYSVDAGEWIPIFPVDEIFDSKEEAFSFNIEPLSPGEHTLVIRATDEAGNVGAGKVVFTLE